MGKLVIALVAVGLMAAPAYAGPDRCLQLVKQLNDDAAFSFDVEAASRPDSVTLAAQSVADEAKALHERDKHDQAVARVQEAFKLAGLSFPQQ